MGRGFKISVKLKYTQMTKDELLKMTRKQLEELKGLERVTIENSKGYVGKEVIFNTRGNNVIKRINRVSDSGKTLYIDHPDLGNNLEIVGRVVYAISKVID